MEIETMDVCPKCGRRTFGCICPDVSESTVLPGSAPKLSYEYDDDSNCITLLVDGKEITEWWCDVEPEEHFKEFRLVFEAGLNYEKA